MSILKLAVFVVATLGLCLAKTTTISTTTDTEPSTPSTTISTTSLVTTMTTTNISTSCDDFSDGLCPLFEDNILNSTVQEGIEECQITCRNTTECTFFSFIGTQCFLLFSCETTEPCPGCMSGPPLPPISECQESTTEAPMTTMTSTISTTCDDFTEGICPLTDENIIITTTAQEAEDCQTVCRSEIYKSDDKVRIG